MSIPSLYEWIDGSEPLGKLIEDFYQRVRKDDLIGPLFAKMGAEHPAHVAAFIGEVFGGPKIYSDKYGGHAAMVRNHMGRHLTEAQRRRWIALLMDSYEDSDLPKDPEFASALASYLEWGSRLAVLNSQLSAKPAIQSPMPKWGWGEVGGPYNPEN